MKTPVRYNNHMSPVDRHNREVLAYVTAKGHNEQVRVSALQAALMFMANPDYKGDQTLEAAYHIADSMLADFIIQKDR